MEGDWFKIVVTTCGVLFAVGGAVSAALQVKWLREQRETLRGILDTLRAMRSDDIRQGVSRIR